MSESIFDLDEFKGYAAPWDARQKIFTERESYYDGSVYAGTRKQLKWFGPRLGAAIRPLYLPLARSVVIDAGSVATICFGISVPGAPGLVVVTVRVGFESRLNSFSTDVVDAVNAGGAQGPVGVTDDVADA